MFGGAILFFIMVADCVSRLFEGIPNRFLSRSPARIHLNTTRYSNISNTNKGWFWSWFIGDHVSSQNCTVQWNWKEPQVVGKTMAFTVQVMTPSKHIFLCSPSRHD